MNKSQVFDARRSQRVAWALFLGAALLAGLLARGACAYTPTRLTDQKRWALATSIILAEVNGNSPELLGGGERTEVRIALQKQSLREWWGVSNREGLLKSLLWIEQGGHRSRFAKMGAQIAAMTPAQLTALKAKMKRDAEAINEIEIVAKHYKRLGKKSLLGWDYARYVSLCRWGYLVGFLSEEEAWQRIMPVARNLQTTFESWEDLGENYLIGRRFWSLNDTQRNGDDFRKVYEGLQTLPASPWCQLAWNLDLTEGADQISVSPGAVDGIGRPVDFSETRPPEAVKTPESAKDRQLAAGLQRAHEARTTNRGAFLAELQSLAALFPEVPVGTDTDNAQPIKLQLNVYGQHVDGMRFRVPLGAPTDMVWWFSMAPRYKFTWYIAPCIGKMASGFKDYQPLIDFVPDLEAGVTGVRRRAMFFQLLSAENLKPGAEYILWFDFENSGMAEIEIAIACLPAGRVENTSEGIANALGQRRIADALTRRAGSGWTRDWFFANSLQDYSKALPAAEAALAASPEDPNAVRMYHFILYQLKRYREAEEFGASRALPIADKSGDKELLFWVLWSQVMALWEDGWADHTPDNSARLKTYMGSGLADSVVALAEELDDDNLRYRAYYLQAIWCTLSVEGSQWDKAMDHAKKALAVAQRNAWPERVSEAMYCMAGLLAGNNMLDESEEWTRCAGLPTHPAAVRRRGN